MTHFVDDQSVVHHEVVAPNHGQVGEHGRERAQAADPVHQQVPGDLPQVGEGDVGEVLRVRVVNQGDLHEALHDRAVPQLVEVLHVVPDVHALANYGLLSCRRDVCLGAKDAPSVRSPRQKKKKSNPKQGAEMEGSTREQERGERSAPLHHH